MGLEPLLEGAGLCQAMEVKAWRDGMALGISSGYTLLFGGREAAEVLVEGCRFLCTSSPHPSMQGICVAPAEDKSY